MANTAQARKRVRQAEKSRQRNAGLRSRMRTQIKKCISAIRTGDKETAQQVFKGMVSEVDVMARKGLLHKNKAARHKSRLNSRIRAMA